MGMGSREATLNYMALKPEQGETERGRIATPETANCKDKSNLRQITGLIFFSDLRKRETCNKFECGNLKIVTNVPEANIFSD